jgi:hypothetical protein
MVCAPGQPVAVVAQRADDPQPGLAQLRQDRGRARALSGDDQIGPLGEQALGRERPQVADIRLLAEGLGRVEAGRVDRNDPVAGPEAVEDLGDCVAEGGDAGGRLRRGAARGERARGKGGEKRAALPGTGRAGWDEPDHLVRISLSLAVTRRR